MLHKVHLRAPSGKHIDHAKLKQVAALINKLGRESEKSHLQFCIAVANAMDIVREEGLIWKRWAEEHLRRPDGKPWGDTVLHRFADIGRNPERIHHYKRIHKVNRVERSLRYISSAKKGKAQTISGDELERQIGALMFAWEAAGAEARMLFLRKIRKIT